MGISPSVLQETMNVYNATWEKCRDNAPGAQYDAYGGGKTHDPFGKKFFHNMPVAMDDEYHVAIVTPTIHYCMGGLAISADGRVLGEDGASIPGLFAAGEVIGGLHGKNRLGGNALSECVVFGRVIGEQIASSLPASVRRMLNHESQFGTSVAHILARAFSSDE